MEEWMYKCAKSIDLISNLITSNVYSIQTKISKWLSFMLKAPYGYTSLQTFLEPMEMKKILSGWIPPALVSRMSKNKLSLITEDVTKTQVRIEVNLQHSMKVLRPVFYFNEWKGKVKSTVLVWATATPCDMGPKHRATQTDGHPRDTLSNGMYFGWEQGEKNANIRYIQVSLKVAALTDGERSSDSRHGRRATVQTGPGWCR